MQGFITIDRRLGGFNMKIKSIKSIGKAVLSCFLSLLIAFPASASEEREVVPGEIRDGVQTYTIDGQEGFMEITPEDIEDGVIGAPVTSVEPEAEEEPEDEVPEIDDDLTLGGVIFMVLSAIFLFIFGIIITIITACFDKKPDKAKD